MFRLTRGEREDRMGDHLPWSETVRLAGSSIDVPDCRDPIDRPFPELALVAGADALLAGDKDRLALTGRFSAPMLAPGAFRGRIFRPFHRKR